jgi:ketosteroid isomerase-like protein
MTPADARKLALLERFMAAWNARDVNALMSCMSDDCEFLSSAGPDPAGTRYRGRDAVNAAYAALFDNFPEAAWTNARHFVIADRGVSEWRFVGRDREGRAVDVYGCDLFTFDGDRIRTKDSYRKNRTG